LEHICTENPPTPTILHGPTPKNHCLQQIGKKSVEDEEEKPN
jgi:hypothetical protein